MTIPARNRRLATAIGAVVLTVLAGCGSEEAPDPAKGTEQVDGSAEQPDGQKGEEWRTRFHSINAEVPGRWHKARRRPRGEGEVVDAKGMAEIASLPYTGGTGKAADGENVTIHEDAALDGVNLVVSGHRPCAQLVDMSGKVLHEWAKDFDEVWPGPLTPSELEEHTHFWRRVHMLPDGGLLAIFEGSGMIKVDAESNLVWEYRGFCHHDLWVADDGTITTLTRQWRDGSSPKRRGYPAFVMGPYFEDYVVTLSPEGKELSSVSILEAFESSKYAAILTQSWRRAGDIWHPNTVNILDGSFADRHPLYAAGNLLVCLRDANAVAVIDPRKKVVVWALSGLWSRPHEPVMVDDGRILLFDNFGDDMKSRVIEFDPLSHDITWCYRGTEDDPFTSEYCGSVQRLRNGNTLVAETGGGRAFELDRAGGIVWEYVNPHRSGDDGQFVASLFDCVRLDHDEVRAALPSLAVK